MAEQASSASSSASSTIRGLVMLLCLVVLPLASLWGTKWAEVTESLPALAKKLSDLRWGPKPALARENPAEDRPGSAQPAPRVPRRTCDSDSMPGSAAETSPARELADGAANGKSDDGASSGIPRTLTGRSADRRIPPGNEIAATNASDRAVAAANYQYDSDGPAAGGQLSSDASSGRVRQAEVGANSDAVHRSSGSRGMGNINRTPLVPVSRRDRDLPPAKPIRPFPARIADVDADADNPAPAVAATDRFTYVLDRLRELGAAYYLLEAWGSEGQRFRFHCKMTVGGNPAYARYFEATDPDPLQAMARVLSEVESWRAGS